MIEIVCTYFLFFIIYSFIGWLLEVSCKLVELKRFVNRGFLIGPLCPIYGSGVVLMILLIGHPTNIFITFIKSIIICSILEYATSYIMEKLFKARWWDYSTKKFNINGRICANTMIPFGLLGCLVIHLLHPNIVKLVSILSSKNLIILSTIIFIIFLIDNALSYIVVGKIKNKIKKNELDNTEAIKNEINEWFSENSILYRRIIEAYPTFMIAVSGLTTNINVSVKKVKKGIDDTADLIAEDYVRTVNNIKSTVKTTKDTAKKVVNDTADMISKDIKRTHKTILITLNDIKTKKVKK